MLNKSVLLYCSVKHIWRKKSCDKFELLRWNAGTNFTIGTNCCNSRSAQFPIFRYLSTTDWNFKNIIQRTVVFIDGRNSTMKAHQQDKNCTDVLKNALNRVDKRWLGCRNSLKRTLQPSTLRQLFTMVRHAQPHGQDELNISSWILKQKLTLLCSIYVLPGTNEVRCWLSEIRIWVLTFPTPWNSVQWKI